MSQDANPITRHIFDDNGSHEKTRYKIKRSKVVLSPKSINNTGAAAGLGFQDNLRNSELNKDDDDVLKVYLQDSSNAQNPNSSLFLLQQQQGQSNQKIAQKAIKSRYGTVS